ncbi:hypothetical protein [Krasilnikovia sp. M28-CT-15]|uniref:hypothetical protein n=1 Tax=Krasilnikovia sp. M28-CT-15 TaxID=3373540 RepID=UPI00399D1B63
MAVNESVAGDDSVAVHGAATGQRTVGVLGEGDSSGVKGVGKGWHGVEGYSGSTIGGAGVYGKGVVTGVAGVGDAFCGVFGESHAPPGAGAAGVLGDGKEHSHGVKGLASGDNIAAVAGFQVADRGPGVHGQGGTGVSGFGMNWVGVYGETHAPSDVGPSGVLGEGLDTGVGVKGHARAQGMAAVAAYHLTGRGPGLYAEGAPAGFFHGDVDVTGDLRLAGADIAEQFDLTEDAEAGTIVVLGDDGTLSPCRDAYDSRVAGVISGAGDRKPALVLDRRDGGRVRRAIAMVGKAWCRADATAAPITVGSMLTTSSTVGCAMAATNRDASFGAVLGKALTPLAAGTGLVLVLVGLA